MDTCLCSPTILFGRIILLTSYKYAYILIFTPLIVTSFNLLNYLPTCRSRIINEYKYYFRCQYLQIIQIRTI